MNWKLWLIPSPWRALLVVLLAGGLSSMGAQLTGSVSNEPLFVSPAREAPMVRTRPSAVLPDLDDVLPFSPELQQRAPDQNDPLPHAAAGEEQPAYESWGRTDVGRSSFWRPDPSVETEAPLEIHAEVSLYRDANGAQQAFQYWSRLLRTAGTPKTVGVPADAVTVYAVSDGPFRFQLIHFQKANGLARVLVTGVEGDGSDRVAASLAQLMSERMQ